MHIFIDLVVFAFHLVTFDWLPAPIRPIAINFAIITVIYIFIVRPKIKQYRIVTGILDKVDADVYSWWGSLLARLSGFKTVILGALAAVMPQLPAILDELNGFTGWHVFLDSGVADETAAVLAAATAVTHVLRHNGGVDACHHYSRSQFGSGRHHQAIRCGLDGL